MGSSIIYSESMDFKAFEKKILDEMKRSVEFLEKEFAKIRTNRVHPSLIEEVRIFAYGSQILLKNAAVITVQDGNCLVIQPFDLSLVEEIEKALSQADLGSQPRNDGKIIKVAIPPLSLSRRNELLKMVQKKHEESLISIRKVRQDFFNEVKEAEKKKKISEDISHKLQKNIQNTLDSVSLLLSSLNKKKEEALFSS